MLRLSYDAHGQVLIPVATERERAATERERAALARIAELEAELRRR